MAETVSVTLYPAALDTTNSSYASISSSYPASNVVGRSSSNTSNYGVGVNLNTGSNAATSIYFSFDVSSIPSDATINSVSCSVGIYGGSYLTTRTSTRTIQLCKSTTKVGTATSWSVAGGTTIPKITADNGGSWTRDELDTLRVLVYVTRSTSNTTTTQAVYIRGIDLVIEYEEAGVKYTLTVEANEFNVTPSTGEYTEGTEVPITISEEEMPKVTLDNVDITDQFTEQELSTEGSYSGAPTAYTTNNLQSGTQYAAYAVGYTADNPYSSTNNYYSNSSTALDNGYAQYTFDVSSVPSNAENITVGCVVAGHAESPTYSHVTGSSSYYSVWALCSNGTEKSEQVYTTSTSNTTITIPDTTWTYDELQNLQLRHYVGYYGGATVGATLNISWTLPSSGKVYVYNLTISGDHLLVLTEADATYLFFKDNGTWTKATNVYKKVNGTWVEQEDLTSLFENGATYSPAINVDATIRATFNQDSLSIEENNTINLKNYLTISQPWATDYIYNNCTWYVGSVGTTSNDYASITTDGVVTCSNNGETVVGLTYVTGGITHNEVLNLTITEQSVDITEYDLSNITSNNTWYVAQSEARDLSNTSFYIELTLTDTATTNQNIFSLGTNVDDWLPGDGNFVIHAYAPASEGSTYVAINYMTGSTNAGRTKYTFAVLDTNNPVIKFAISPAGCYVNGTQYTDTDSNTEFYALWNAATAITIGSQEGSTRSTANYTSIKAYSTILSAEEMEIMTTIEAVKPTSVSFTASDLTVNVDETINMGNFLSVNPDEATSWLLDNAIWFVGQAGTVYNDYATINGSGVLTGIAEGSTTVGLTYTVDNVTYTASTNIAIEASEVIQGTSLDLSNITSGSKFYLANGATYDVANTSFFVDLDINTANTVENVISFGTSQITAWASTSGNFVLHVYAPGSNGSTYANFDYGVNGSTSTNRNFQVFASGTKMRLAIGAHGLYVNGIEIIADGASVLNYWTGTTMYIGSQEGSTRSTATYNAVTSYASALTADELYKLSLYGTLETIKPTAVEFASDSITVGEGSTLSMVNYLTVTPSDATDWVANHGSWFVGQEGTLSDAYVSITSNGTLTANVTGGTSTVGLTWTVNNVTYTATTTVTVSDTSSLVVGEISSANVISLNTSALGSGTYTLVYEDADNNTSTDWGEIGTITLD